MVEIAKKQNMFWQGVCWQFYDVPKEILKGWRNFLRFNLNYFSIFLLARTLFSPWRRYHWLPSGRGFNLKAWLEARLSNLISRILGAIIRTILLLIGFLVEIFIILGGALVFVGWLVSPLFLIGGLLFGLKVLF